MIVSNKWMRAGYGENLRKFLTQKQGHRLIDLGPGIFDSATVDTCIYIGSNTKAMAPFKAVTITKGEEVVEALEQKSVDFAPPLSGDSWVIMNPIELQIKQKIEQYGTPLKDWDIQINYGIKTGYNEAFIIDGVTKDRLIAEDPKNAEIIKPILRGRDIKRYKAEFADLWLIFTAPALKIDIEKYPSIKQHLLTFGYDKLRQEGLRDEKGNLTSRKKSTNKWFELQDSIGYFQEFEKEKIIFPNMTKFLPFIYDDKFTYVNQKCYFITGKKLLFLLSVFNSKVCSYWIKENSPELQGGTREIEERVFRNFTAPQIREEEQRPFEELVEQILTKKERGENTDAEERRIDEMVYSLYHLTPDEINHIEGKE